MPRNKFSLLHKLQGLTYDKFEQNLSIEAKDLIELPTFFEPSNGLQFFLMGDDDFDSMDEKTVSPIELPMKGDYEVQIPLAIGSSSYHLPHQYKGLMISSWLKDVMPHPGCISARFIQISLECVGAGYDNRTVSHAWGQNHYVGSRLSDISQPSPVKGKGRAYLCEYY